MYVDFSVFAAHHMRTAKSQKVAGMIMGPDGYLCRIEQKGPPDHATYAECAAVHECAVIMARMVTPPRIHHYLRMQADFAREYPESWALPYQQDDRYRYKRFPQDLRKLHTQADRQIAGLTWSHGDEESSSGPDYPFEHILWLAVNGRRAYQWWQDNFIRHTDKVQHGIKRLADYLDGDAPIAADRASHAITSHRQTAAGTQTRAPLPAHPIFPQLTKKEKKRKGAAANDATPQQGGGHNPNQGGASQSGAQYTKNHSKAQGHDICL